MPRKTVIHVNNHVIRRNRKTGGRDPAITVRDYRGTTAAHAVSIAGPSRVVYSPDRPLKCGATCWIETTAEVTILEPDEAATCPR